MPAPEDHAVLDTIYEALKPEHFTLHREGECIEFEDDDGCWEIVIRKIDHLSKQEPAT